MSSGQARTERGIQQAQGASCRIARVGKGLLPFLFELLIELRKGCSGHVDLAPDFEALQSAQRSPQAQGNAANGPQVLRNVFTNATVTPCGTAGQDATRIEQGHTETVDLRLYHIGALLPG